MMDFGDALGLTKAKTNSDIYYSISVSAGNTIKYENNLFVIPIPDKAVDYVGLKETDEHQV